MNRNHLRGRPVLLLLVISAAVTLGCGARKELTKGPEWELMLEYRKTDDRVLRYRTANRFVQTMDILGQEMQVKADETREFSLRYRASGGDDLGFEVTVDSMRMKITSPQGELVPDVSTVIGRSFNMTISPLGEELELSGADMIAYDLGPQGKRSIKSQFEAFFPDLPGRPVALGESWTTETTITEKSSAGDMTIALKIENRMVGFETVDGFECVKIEAPFTGTLDGRSTEEGRPITTKAEIKGTGFWYFAHKEGIYVRETSSGVAEGTITAAGPTNVGVHFKRDFVIAVNLIE